MKFYIETYGCSANFAESEAMVSLLIDAGHELVSDESKADVIILNTCGVKDPTEHKILYRMEQLKDRKVVITGCLPLIRIDLVDIYPQFSYLSPDKEFRIVEAVEEHLIDLEKLSKPKLIHKHFRFNPLVEIVPISQGCTGNCTYCATKFARGHIRSYEPESIIKQVEYAVNSGAKEIWITSQDTGAYGVDIGSSLPSLLKKIITKVDGDYHIRVGMMNVDHAQRIFDKLMEVYEDEHLFKFLHVPVQSGSDSVLTHMHRNYYVSDFENLVKSFREKFPLSTLSTDMIVGYPTETKEDFMQSVALVKRVVPDVVNISKFSPRPGTVAAKLKRLNTKELKNRSRILSKVAHEASLVRNKLWLNWEGWVLIDEKGKNGEFKGRNEHYKQIVVNGAKFGDIVNVKIFEVGVSYLKGKIINL